jgi:ribonuclease-3
MPVGDIRVPGLLLAERKTRSDLVSSLRSGRLADQVRRLREACDESGEVPVLVFEDRFPAFGAAPADFESRTVAHALMGISLRDRVHVVTNTGPDSTLAWALDVLSRTERLAPRRQAEPGCRHGASTVGRRPREEVTPRSVAVNLLASCPGLSERAAAAVVDAVSPGDPSPSGVVAALASAPDPVAAVADTVVGSAKGSAKGAARGRRVGGKVAARLVALLAPGAPCPPCAPAGADGRRGGEGEAAAPGLAAAPGAPPPTPDVPAWIAGFWPEPDREDLSRCLTPGDPHCEAMEFLGDAVLYSFAARYLVTRYPAQREGFVSSMRTKMVMGKTLARLADRVGLVDSVAETTGRDRGSVTADQAEDCFEAVVGKMSLAAGDERVRAWLAHVYEAHFDFAGAVVTSVSNRELLETVSRECRAGKVEIEVAAVADGRHKAVASVGGVPVGIGVGPTPKAASSEACASGARYLSAKHQ